MHSIFVALPKYMYGQRLEACGHFRYQHACLLAAACLFAQPSASLFHVACQHNGISFLLYILVE